MQETDAAAALAALGNPVRLRLFRLLMRAGDDGINVGDMQKLMDVPASTLAHHITHLARADLIRQQRHGREVITRADYPNMHALMNYLTEQCCAGVGHLIGDEAA